MTKKIIEITVVTERLMVIHRRHRAVQAWCPSCNSQVEMVTPFEAALIVGVSPGTVRRLMEAGVIHSVFDAEGEELICLKSLRGGFDTVL